jgi:hypothetical protein
MPNGCDHPGLVSANPLLGIDKAECRAEDSVGGNRLFRIGARARGRSPKTLSLGWLPAVRFIPKERVLGDLPPTVDLRSPLFGHWLYDEI